MIRMILEGEKGKSEDVFWSSIFTGFDKDFLLYFCRGNKNIYNEVKAACVDFRKEDMVLYAVDEYNFDYYNAGIELLLTEQKKIGFRLAMMEYSSFEGIFVSYSRLLNFVRVGNKGL